MSGTQIYKKLQKRKYRLGAPVLLAIAIQFSITLMPAYSSNSPTFTSPTSILSLPTVDSLTPSSGGAPGAPTFTPLCLPSIDTGPKLQVIYAYDSSKGVSPTKLASIRTMIQEADRIVFLSADKQGGGRRLRIATERTGNSCQVSVITVPASSADLNSGSTSIIDNQLISAGVLADSSIENSINLGTIPVVFFDSDPNNNAQCGLGTTTFDDAVDGANSLPQSGQASIWANCWNAHTTVHEIMHTLGAVQSTAPHATFSNHCFDGIDPMCYDDGSLNSVQQLICPSTPYRPGGLLDCNADDYFAISPPKGTYLSDHFNIANNSPYIQNIPYSGISWPSIKITSISAPSALPFTGVSFTADVIAPGGFLFAGSSYTYGNDHCGVRLSKSTDYPPSSSLFSISGVAYCRSPYSQITDPNNNVLANSFPSEGAKFSVVDQLGRDTAGQVIFQYIKTTSIFPVKATYSIKKPNLSNGNNYVVTLTVKGKGPGNKSFDTPLVGLQYQVLDQSTMKSISVDGNSNMEVTSEGNGTMKFIFPSKLKGHLIDLENDDLDGNINWNLPISQFKLPK